MRLIPIAIFASLVLAAEPIHVSRSRPILTPEAARAVLQEVSTSDPWFKASRALFMVEQAQTQDVLRIILDECKDITEVKEIFAIGSRTLSRSSHLFLDFLVVKGYMNELLKGHRFDLLEVFIEAGFVNDETFAFETPTLDLETILFLFKNKLNLNCANMFAFRYMCLSRATVEDLRTLHESGLSLVHVEYDPFAKGLLEILMEVGNIEAAYYAHQHGCRVLRSRIEGEWYVNFSSQPEDLCSYIIGKNFADRVILFVLSKNDEGSLFGKIPGELNSDHLAPALVAAIIRSTFDDLFYPELDTQY